MDGLWAMKSEGLGLIVREFNISNLCDPDPPTPQTDKRTNDMQSQYRILHYRASHAKNELSF